MTELIKAYGGPAIMVGIAAYAGYRWLCNSPRTDGLGAGRARPTQPGRGLRGPAPPSASRLLVDILKRLPHHPDFFMGSLAEAIEASKRQGCMLAVYLAPSGAAPGAGSPPSADSFAQNALCNEFVSDILRENYITWAGVCMAPETVHLCRALNVTAGPFMAVLAVPTGGPQRNQLALVMRATGDIPAGELLVRLVEVIERREQLMSQQARLQAQRDVGLTDARLLVQEQDREYQEALEADRAMQRQIEESVAQAEEAKVAQLTAEAQSRASQVQAEEHEARLRQAKQSRRDAKKNALPVEPESTADAVNVRLRLPDGSRPERKFSPSATMRVIFDFIESHELLTTGGAEIEPDLDHYRVVTTHPRRQFLDADANLQSLGLGRNCLFIVEEVQADALDDCAAPPTQPELIELI